MARRTLNRREMRADFDAAERRKEDEDRDEDEEDEDEDDDEEGEGEAEEAEEEEDDAEEDSGDDDSEDEDGAPKKKKKKKAKPKEPKPKAKPRSRAAKIVRMRQVWGVFNNSHQMVASYEYPRREEADAHAAKLMADKKQTHFVQPVREPIEEKADPEAEAPTPKKKK